MSWIAYWIVRAAVGLLQTLPLRLAAFIGRAGGAIAWVFNRRHRAVVLENLRAAFPEKSEAEILALGRETMKRVGENYTAAVKTSSMDLKSLLKVCELEGLEKLARVGGTAEPRNCVVAIGHFGNFELYAMLGQTVPGFQPATTYRGLKQPRMNEIMTRLRNRSGCRFFERRTEAGELKEALRKGGLLLGLLADQHISRGGIWIPFMGRNCATTTAPAVLALRYDAPLFTAICYRTALGRWRIEVGDEIPTRENSANRRLEAISIDMNRAFERAVRRDPPNWFWVHKRWKPRPVNPPPGRPNMPASDLAMEPAPL